MEMSGQLHALAALPPGSTGEEAEWVPEMVWMRWEKRSEFLPPSQIKPWLSSPQPRHYSD